MDLLANDLGLCLFLSKITVTRLLAPPKWSYKKLRYGPTQRAVTSVLVSIYLFCPSMLSEKFDLVATPESGNSSWPGSDVLILSQDSRQLSMSQSEGRAGEVSRDY